MSEDLKARLRRVPDEAFNEGNLEVLDELFAPDYVLHDPASPEDIRGIDGIRQYVQTFREAFPDLRITVDNQVAEGDTVVTRWSAQGTHDGPLMGVPPTGNEVTVRGIIESRFSGDKIAEEWQSLDTLGLMQQVGAVTTGEQPA